jgi:hypothetical protein
VRHIVLWIDVKQRSSSGPQAISDDSGQKTSEAHLIACIKLLFFVFDNLLKPGRL